MQFHKIQLGGSAEEVWQEVEEEEPCEEALEEEGGDARDKERSDHENGQGDKTLKNSG